MADFGNQSGMDEAARRSPPPPDRSPPPPDGPSAIDEVRLLIAAGRQFATAEIAYQSARARLMGKAAVWIAAGGGLALMLMFFVTMALVVGLLLALGTVLGPWGALAAVVGGLLVATLLAGLVAWLGLRKFLALLNDGKDPA